MQAKLTTKTVQSLEPQAARYEVRDSDLAGFLVRVSPTGAKVYYIDYRRPDGRRTRLCLGDSSVLTPSQARDEARKAIGDVVRGMDPAAVRKAARRESLGEFIEGRYMSWAGAHLKTGVASAKQSLVHFAEFKGLALSDISPKKVEAWRAARLIAGLKRASVNRYVAVLKAILQKAVNWEAIPVNPLAKVKPLKTDSSAKVRFLDSAEERRLRAALDQREEGLRAERSRYNLWLAERHREPYPDLDRCAFADHLKPMVLLSINTGLRRGELFNLRWEDVDLSRPSRPNLTVGGATAKSGKTRHIPLNREAFETLRDWKGQTVGSGLVFASFDGNRFDNVRSSWETVLELAGICSFRWHDLRHHFASRLVMEGVDLARVRDLLGHADFKMTLRYAHLAPAALADAVAKLDQPRAVEDRNIPAS